MPVTTLVERELQVTNVADDLDLNKVVEQVGDVEANEVSTNAFIAYVMKLYDATIEFARDLIYFFIELGKLVLTARYTLQPVA